MAWVSTARRSRCRPYVEVRLPHRGVPLHLGGAEDVVDQHVQGALLVVDAGDQGLDLGGDQVVDPHRDPVPAGFVDQRGRLFDGLGPRHLRALIAAGAAGAVDGGAGRAQLDGDAAAGGPARPRHQGDLALQRPRHGRTCFSYRWTATVTVPDAVRAA